MWPGGGVARSGGARRGAEGAQQGPRNQRTLSGIPPEQFLSSADAPRDRADFLAFLNEKNVAYLVVVKKEDSIPSKLFPKECGERIGPFESVMHAVSAFLPTNICLYQANSGE